MDRALATALTERFGSTLLTPVRQRFDETEIRVSVADAIQTLRALHDEPEFSFEMLIDLCAGGVSPLIVTKRRLASRDCPWYRPQCAACELTRLTLARCRMDGARGV
jgi:hypothetical protein